MKNMYSAVKTGVLDLLTAIGIVLGAIGIVVLVYPVVRWLCIVLVALTVYHQVNNWIVF